MAQWWSLVTLALIDSFFFTKSLLPRVPPLGSNLTKTHHFLTNKLFVTLEVINRHKGVRWGWGTLPPAPYLSTWRNPLRHSSRGPHLLTPPFLRRNGLSDWLLWGNDHAHSVQSPEPSFTFPSWYKGCPLVLFLSNEAQECADNGGEEEGPEEEGSCRRFSSISDWQVSLNTSGEYQQAHSVTAFNLDFSH